MNTQYGNETLSAEDQLAYQFAEQSYKSPSERTSIGDYEYDTSASNEDTGIWNNHKTKETRIGNRGSTTKYDFLVSDFTGILPGMEKYDKRHQRALKQTIDAHNKYGYDVWSHGHSLGQSLSNYTTEELGENDWMKGTIGFNPGVSTIGRGNYFSKTRRACRSENPPKYCSKTTNLYEANDYISNNNALCSYMTLGTGGRICRKSVGYGTGKFYDHRKPSKWYHNITNLVTPIRAYNNKSQHTLQVFNKR